MPPDLDVASHQGESAIWSTVFKRHVPGCSGLRGIVPQWAASTWKRRRGLRVCSLDRTSRCEAPVPSALPAPSALSGQNKTQKGKTDKCCTLKWAHMTSGVTVRELIAYKNREQRPIHYSRDTVTWFIRTEIIRSILSTGYTSLTQFFTYDLFR